MNNTDQQPPRWADRFLEWFCHPDLLEEIQGDIHELYEYRQQQADSKAARRGFIWDVLRSFRFSTIRNFDPLISSDMLKMNTRIAIRRMLKQKVFSLIKIGGFALGMAACLLIGLYIHDELSYDRHYADGDRLYRMIGNDADYGTASQNVFFPAPLAKTLRQDYPQIEIAARIAPGGLFGGGSNTLRRADGKESFFEDGFILADPEMIELLEIPIVQGDEREVLQAPFSVVISQSKAALYFPGEDPIGKVIIINDEVETPYTINAVMKDIPQHSHLAPINFLVTLEGVEFWPGEQELWRANNYHTYLKLQAGTDPQAMEKKLLSLIDNYYIPSRLEAGIENAKEEVSDLSFTLQPISSIYLESAGIVDLLPHGDARFVRLLGAIVILILLLAIFNFVNLAIAKSANRAREVGLRKVVGSRRGQLIQQFLTESVLISGLALTLSLIIAYALLPFFNDLTEKALAIPWRQIWFLPGFALGAIILGVFAGFYPAIFLSKFKPIDVLRGHLSRGAKSSALRNMLVVFQFTSSVLLIISTLVIYEQMEFILSTKLGFDKEQVVILQGTNTLGDKVYPFKEEISRLSSVKSVSVGDYLPINGTQRNENVFLTEEEERVAGQFWLVDHDYIPTMGMKIVQGRDFSTEFATDSSAVIINEAMAAQLGYASPLGKRLSNGPAWEIIGVVADFHYSSLKEDIQPLTMVLSESPYMVSVKGTAQEMDELIAQIKPIWETFAPDQAFTYTFLDQEFAGMYKDVFRTRDVFLAFALLAVFIACLGLFALSTFLAEQRRKEISTRKVLGASNTSIIWLLSQNYLLLIGISLVIAFPLAWYMMRTWLNDFSYRIELNWPVFALSGVLAFLVALLTISYQTLRAARLSPADYLR